MKNIYAKLGSKTAEAIKLENDKNSMKISDESFKTDPLVKNLQVDNVDIKSASKVGFICEE